jgi:hypothetical protein
MINWPQKGAEVTKKEGLVLSVLSLFAAILGMFNPSPQC